MKTFKIDFFELAFLAEACIPPRPIARSMFWGKICNEYYYQMGQDERLRLFEWIKPQLDMDNEDCRLFFARYNPENQYRVSTEFNGDHETIDCFRFNDQYHLCKGTTVNETYITKEEMINP